MDGLFVANRAMGSAFGIAPPAGFGYDFAGVVDEVGDGATGFAVADRVYGGAMAKAVADFVIVATPADTVWHTPEGLSDEIAGTLPVAGKTAAAVVSAIGVGAGDTVLVGGAAGGVGVLTVQLARLASAAGGVGVLTVQLARLASAAVTGTASEATFDFLRKLGAEPVAYGDGLADRVRAMAPGRARARRGTGQDCHDRRRPQPAARRPRDPGSSGCHSRRSGPGRSQDPRR